MSSVELEVIHEDVGTAEDDHRKDTLRWGFKSVDNPSDAAFLWVEDGRLWANTPTIQLQHPVPVMQSSPSPDLIAENTQVSLGASLPPQAVSYVAPRSRVAVDVHDMASSSSYLVKVGFDGGGVFRLHVDTGSPISWVCGFDRETQDAKFDLTRTPEIPCSNFEADYGDLMHVSGVLSQTRAATFGNGAFRLKYWTFCVATSADGLMQRAILDGVLALSYHRPPGGSGKTQFHPGVEAETFVESLLRARLLHRTYTFCIKLRHQAPGTITFGTLPDLGSPYDFQDAVADRWALTSTYIGFVDSNGHEFEHSYKVKGDKLNVALFETGTANIFLDDEAVDWLYRMLCGDGNYKNVNGTRYIEADGIAKLDDSGINFNFGNRRFTLPAKILPGKFSTDVGAYVGTIQGKSGGPMVDDDHWSFDIMGTAFFKHVLVAFDTYSPAAKIAIHVNSSEENHED